MKLKSVLLAGMIALTTGLLSCGPKDADIKTQIDNAMKADPSTAGATVDVKDGVATIAGEFKDETSKANFVKMVTGIKGVKSVTDNSTVAPPPPPPVPQPASMTTVLDDATQQKVKDGLKDIPGVTVSFEGDRAVLTGEVSKADRMKIMQILSRAKVKSDVAKLTDKK